MKKIGVLGAGSWGTALTWLLTNNGHEVTLWSIMEAEVEMLRTKREHTSKLPGVKLQESIQLTSNLEEAMADKDVLVLADRLSCTKDPVQCPGNTKIKDPCQQTENRWWIRGKTVGGSGSFPGFCHLEDRKTLYDHLQQTGISDRIFPTA